MIPRLVFILISAALACAAQESWADVRSVKSGSELRIYKKGDKKPVTGNVSEISEESVVVSVKHGQESIPREEIAKVELRVNAPHEEQEPDSLAHRRRTGARAKFHYKTIYQARKDQS